MTPTPLPTIRIAALCGAVLAAALPAATAHGATPKPATSPAVALDTTAVPDRAGSVSSGATTITLTPAVTGALNRAHVKLGASGDASLRGRALRLPIDPASRLDPTSFQGVLLHDGGLSLRGPSGGVTLSALTLTRLGTSSPLTAKVGKHVVAIGTIKGGATNFKQPAAATLAGATVTLSKAGASAVNRAVGSHAMRAGTLGSATITTDSKELPIAAGTAALTLDPAFLGQLQSNGIGLQAVAPATLTDGTVTLPISGGAFDPFGKTGRIWLAGSIALVGATQQIPLGNFRVDASTAANQTLSALLPNGIGAQIGQLDLSGLSVALQGAAFTAANARVSLTKIGSGVIQQALGASLPAGTLFGTTALAGQLATGP